MTAMCRHQSPSIPWRWFCWWQVVTAALKGLRMLMEDMSKICQLSSYSKPVRSFQLKKHTQSDHITKLPDELLCNIISHLTLVEAARTSVLARRWNKIWYHFHGTLEFDDTKKIMFLEENRKKQAVYDYLSSNTQVLQLLPSPSFDAFKVCCYNVDKSCESHLDFFVQFAMKKRMKSLEFDTLPSPMFFGVNYYNLPLEFHDWIRKPCGLDCISSLTSISLKQVNVSDDIIHHLLVSCPLLESLCVKGSYDKLVNPKFIGGTLKLKYLEICGFYDYFESITICAPNLSFFSTQSTGVKLFIQNAPKLVEMSLPVEILRDSPESVSSYLPHLERLTWDFSYCNQLNTIDWMPQFVVHNKLRHLTWKLGNQYYDKYTIKLNSLLEASPFLHKFTVVILLNRRRTQKMVPTVTANHPHQCLKVLQIVGFTGADAEVNLVRYFLANTISLEEIILDTIDPSTRGTPWETKPYHLRRSKLGAHKLKKDLPSRVSLVILEE